MPPSDHSLFWNMTLHTSLLNNPWSSNRGNSGSINHNNHNNHKDKRSHPSTVPSMSLLSSSSYSLAGYSFPFTNSNHRHRLHHSHHNNNKKKRLNSTVALSSQPISRGNMQRPTPPPAQRTDPYPNGRRVNFGSQSMTTTSSSSKDTTIVETIHPILSLFDYTESELQATWYNKTELRAMKQQCRDDAIQVHYYSDHCAAAYYDYDSNSSSSQEEDQRDDSTTSIVRSSNPIEEGEDHECVLLLTHWMNRVKVGALSSPTTTAAKTTTTPRGLESKSSEGAIRKKRHRTQALSAVLSEQRRQRRFGIKDDEAIADAYFEVSEPCHVAANMMGIRDAREVVLLASSSSSADADHDKENRVSPLSRDSSLSSFDEIMRGDALE